MLQNTAAGDGMAVAEYVDALTKLCMQGHAQFARSHAEALIEADPVMGHLGRATVAGMTGDVAAARASVDAAARIAPEHPGVLQARAIVSALSGDGAGAVQAARTAARMDPSARSRNGLARMLLSVGQQAEAVVILEALVAECDDPDAHMQLAEEKKAADENASLKHLVDAFLAAPSDPRAMQSLMQILRNNAWPIGVAILARHLRTQAFNPGFRFVVDLLGIGALEYLRNTPWEGLVETPDSVYAKALLAAREVPIGAQAELAGLLIDRSRLADARTLLRSIGSMAATAAERSRHAFLDGRLAAAEGDSGRAAANYRAALTHDPLNTDAATNLVDLLIASGRPEALVEVGSVLAAIPEVVRRQELALTYNEAVWCEARGDKQRALALVRFLREGPLERFESGVGAMQLRLEGTAPVVN